MKPLLILLLICKSALCAFDIEKVKHDIFNQLSKDLKKIPKNKPLLLLIGGYPGAGKTTLINALVKMYDIDVISWNHIRQALLDRNLKGSPYDWDIIVSVNENLFKICLENHANVVIDINAYEKNIKLFEELLEKEHCQDQYRVLKICLNPPLDLLMTRVKTREKNAHIHQGTENDVIRDYNSDHKKIIPSDYSLIIKNDHEIDFETELNIVNAFLKPHFKNQN